MPVFLPVLLRVTGGEISRYFMEVLSGYRTGFYRRGDEIIVGGTGD